jgi:membrane protease YdiL (CAAX protease family)
MPKSVVTSGPSADRRPLAFFAVALALAIPVWLLSRVVGVIGALKIPVTDLLLGFTPLAAASILVWRGEGLPGLVRFLQRTLDYRRLARSRWLAVVLLLAPCIYALTYFGLHLAGRTGEPRSNVLSLPLLAAIMFVLAIGEEAGWTGYLLEPLQVRLGALGASLAIAFPWWLGHIPSILEIGGTAADVGWWFPGAIALRILMTWLYNNTHGSVLAVVLFHTLLNVGRSAAYPTVGSHYDPIYQATGYLIALAIALLVLAVWGARRLRHAETMTL